MKPFALFAPLALLAALAPVRAQEGWRLGLSPHVGLTVSRSLQSSTLPLRAGYPHFLTRAFLLDLELEREAPRFRHLLAARLAWPAAVRSEDGSGLEETLLDTGGSRLAALSLGYQPAWRFRPARWLALEAGPAAGVSLELRRLDYLSGNTSHRREAAFGLGPGLGLGLRLASGLDLRAGFRALFFLPWLGIGEVEYRYADGTPYYRALYRPLAYESAAELLLRGRLGARWELEGGYRRMDWIGYGSRRPFDAGDIVSWRLDSRDELLLGARWRLGGAGR